jgi:PAS domain S-box-containing protein
MAILLYHPEIHAVSIPHHHYLCSTTAEAIPQLVWITAPDGYHEYFNQRWYEYTGTTLEQTRGEGWSQLLHPDDYERTLEVWQHSLRTGELYEIEYRFKEAKTGKYRWFLGRSHPIRDNNGAITRWFGTCTDIDDQKRAEVTLRAQAEELGYTAALLEERNRELDQFAYVTSHDLKAPLRGIANLSQWIEEDLGDNATEEIRKQLDLLRGRVHRMEGLIDGILQYSRIGRLQGTIEQVDVDELLADVVDLLAPPPGFNITIEPEMPTIMTERVLLQQVFANLIGNAIKHHHRSEGTIHVSAEPNHTHFIFRVADDGPGIAPQYQDRIFGMFQTLAPRDKVEGSGLGLSLVKKMVEHQGGRIWVQSEEGQEATFCFTWPKSAQSPSGDTA